MVKNPLANAGDIRDLDLIPGLGKISWSRVWQPTPVLLPEKFHGQKSLVGCGPWGLKELDMTEATEHTFFISLAYWVLVAAHSIFDVDGMRLCSRSMWDPVP